MCSVYRCAVLYCIVFSCDTCWLQRHIPHKQTKSLITKNRYDKGINSPELAINYSMNVGYSYVGIQYVCVCLLIFTLVPTETNVMRLVTLLQLGVCTWLQLARWAFSPDTLE